MLDAFGVLSFKHPVAHLLLSSHTLSLTFAPESLLLPLSPSCSLSLAGLGGALSGWNSRLRPYWSRSFEWEELRVRFLWGGVSCVCGYGNVLALLVGPYCHSGIVSHIHTLYMMHVHLLEVA